MAQLYNLTSPDGNSIIEISSLGAQILSYRINDTKIFHENEINYRRCGMPVLFPFAGPLEEGKFTLTETKLPQHGFGRDVQWQIYQKSDHEDYNSISFALTNSDVPEIWQNNYPFPYIVMLHYYLGNDLLSVDLTVMNPLQEDLQVPLKPGFHPYFDCPKDQKINIKFEGQPVLKSLDWSKQFDAIFIDPKKGVTKFSIGNISFVTTMKHRIYKLSNESKSIILDLNNKTVIWSEMDEDFVCIEPIAGPFNSVNYNPILVQKGQGYNFNYQIKTKKLS